MKRIGLIDADLMWRKQAPGRRYGKTKADIYHNLVLMKLSAFYKNNGHEVEWYNPFNGRYDIVFVSKVFSSTPESREFINADRVIRGGSGYCIQYDGGKEVWREPELEGFFYTGFLTR